MNQEEKATSHLVLKKKSTSALRQVLDEQQKKLLDSILEYWKKEKKWIPTRVLHHKFTKKRALQILRSLGGSLVLEMPDGHSSRYELTQLGFLSTSQGEFFEKLLAQYVGYIHERFQADPELQEVRSEEVVKKLKLRPEESEDLFYLIRDGGFNSGCSFSCRLWFGGKA